MSFVLRASRSFALAVSLFTLLLAGCGAHPAADVPSVTGEVTLQGFVHGGQQPISGATIQLYAAGTTGDASAATPLIAPVVLTGAAGDFSITGLYTCPSITAEVYLIASGGNPGLAPGTNNTAAVSMSALGPCGNLTSATHIIINEVSTIGSIYPLTSFMNSWQTVGSSSANFNTFASDFMLINQYINTDGGQSPGPALPGGYTAPVANLNTLANSVAACINSTGGVAGDGSACGNLFLYAKPSAGAAPTNTADAVLDIANNPTQNVNAIYGLASASGPFQPALSSAPADWTLKILPNVTLSTTANLVGVGSTSTGTITLGQAAPAGGLVVTLTTTNAAAVTVVSPVNIAAGATTASFSYTGVAAGTATLSATAPGYVGSSVTESATASLISLGVVPTVAPGQSLDLPLSLGTAAPAGGVTINFTSTNPAVATVSPANVFIAAGLKVPTANPQVTGVTVGSAQINATAAAYAPGARGVTVSVTASFPATFSVPVGTPTNETLTISAPAPAGGITFNLSVDNGAIFSVPATVTVAQGATTVNVPITGIAPGTTNLRADSANITEAVSSVSVNGTINLQSTSLTTGVQLEVSSYFYFGTAPPAPVTATITSAAPGIATVSTSATVLGTATASVSGITSANAVSYWVQGVATGSTTLTISAPGYLNSTVNITVDPSGFVFTNGSTLTTTTLSADTGLTIYPAILNPGSLTVLGYGALTPAANVNVAVGSSDGTVGTILNGPAAFVAGASSEAVNFHPVGSGSANLTLTTPGGFSTPAPAGTQTVAATVTAPPINLQTSTITSGVGLEVSTYAYLSQTPKVPTNVTLTSANPGVAVVSTSPTGAGGGTATVSSVVSGSAFTFYIQGVSVGSTTVTVSATPYTSATLTVTVDPSGFAIVSPGTTFSTTTFSTATGLTVYPAILNPGSLTVLGYAAVSPLAAPVNVALTSGTPAVGTITSSPLVFHGGDSSASTNFQPAGSGSSVLSLATPGGFSTPAAGQSTTATVTAPPIYEQTSSVTTGINMQVGTYVYLSQPPPTAITVTLTSDTPAVATVSSSATIAGAATTTFPNTVSGSALSFWIQGQKAGTATVTATAPGYQPISIAVTVDPSGFAIVSPGSTFTTTTFSPATSVAVYPAILNPTTLAVIGYAALNPGIGTVSVGVTSSATQVGTVTTPATFSANSSSQTLTFQPVAAGSTTISIATPAGYSTPTPVATQQIVGTVTAPPIYTQTTSVTTGVNLELSTYVYLSQTPPSPVTVSVVSGSTSIATLSTSATTLGTGTVTYNSVAAGNALSFYVQGHGVGSTTLTISAAGYANATIGVTVDPSGFTIVSPGTTFSTTTFSAPTSVLVYPTILTPGTLTVVGYATVSPGAGSPSITIASSTPATGTVTSPIVLNAGDSSGSSSFQPVAAGTTNLSITTPAGYSTPSAAATQTITATVTAPPIYTQVGSLATGTGLEVSTYTYLSQTPPAAVTVTVTSSNPAVAVISKSATVVGANSISFVGVTNGAALSYYVQGLATGSATLTISAPGFTNATVTVATDPSSFTVVSGNFTTTTFSSTTAVTIYPTILNPGVLTVLGYATLSPGGSVAVATNSSAPGVGTVTSPVVFNPGDSSQNSTFTPVGVGSSTISITTPAGFTTPSQVNNQQITATVTAPPIYSQSTSLTTGANLQLASYVYLSQAPPAPVTVTMTVANPAVAVVSANATTAGNGTLSFSSVANGSALSFYLQGLTVGSTTITLSAPGFANGSIAVTVDPSGFVIASPGNFSTTVGAADTSVLVYPAILNSGVLTVFGYGQLNPGLGSVTVPIGSTSPQIGTIAPGSLVFNAGDASKTATFHALSTGSTAIDLVSQPAGFVIPSQPSTQQIVVTVQ